MVSLIYSIRHKRYIFAVCTGVGFLLLLLLFFRSITPPRVHAVVNAHFQTVAVLGDQSPSIEAGEAFKSVPLKTIRQQQQGQSIKLPYRQTRNGKTGVEWFIYSIPLDEKNLADGKGLLDVDALELENEYGLIFVQIINGGDFYLNGHWVAGLAQSTATERWMWYEPFVVPLPSRLLNKDGTPNVLTVTQATVEPFISVPRPYFGNMAELERIYSVVRFISSTLTHAFEVLCVAAGLCLIGIWITSPKERIYVWAGSASIFWAVMFLVSRLQTTNAEMRELWRWLVFVCEGGVVCVTIFFILAFMDRRPGPGARYLIIGVSTVAAIVYPWGGSATEYYLDLIWTPVAIMLFAYAPILLIAYWWRTRSTPAAIFLLQSILLILFALHDYAVHLQLSDPLGSLLLEPGWTGLFFGRVYLLHLAMPFLLVAMASMLVSRYHDKVIRLGSSNLVLQRREIELKAIYHKREVSALSNATLVERERIYQDIHDGIGSQLVKAIFTLRNAEADSSAVVANLRACLNDLRLVIDSNPESDVDIQNTVFAFCVTQEQHLEGSGLVITYDVGVESTSYANPKVALNVLRVLQESLGNTLKYSGATHIDIKLTTTEDSLVLTITDNGHSRSALQLQEQICTYGASGKRGVTGLALRAADIGATYAIDITEIGTKVCLDIPISGSC